jgi:hypothetical protein
LLLGLAAIPAALPRARAAEGVQGITAVSSKVSDDSVRAKLPDGTFAPEAYAFGEGGNWGGQMSDATIDRLHFADVARIIAGPLATPSYLPASDPGRTKLLIMVYWGTTHAPEHAADSAAYTAVFDLSNKMKGPPVPGNSSGKPKFGDESALEAAMLLAQMENVQRDRVNLKNAEMLGYDSWWAATRRFENTGFGFGYERQDMVDELERDRYFVVLMAYDFQLLWKEKRHKLLWETRFSIDERRNQFDKALPVMAQYASQYFGRDSKGLLRTRVPEGRVDVGEVKSLGEVPGR